MSVNNKIWGKTVSTGEYYPLVAHMLDVATTSQILFNHWLRPGLKEIIVNDIESEKSLDLVSYMAGIHDIGKCSSIFQGALLGRDKTYLIHAQQRDGLKADGFTFPEVQAKRDMRSNLLHRHEKIGTVILESMKDDFLESSAQKHALSLATLGHHGSFSISLSSGRYSQIDDLEEFLDQSWVVEQKKIINLLQKTFSLESSDLEFSLNPTTIILLSGLIIMADRLASSTIIAEQGIQMISEGELTIQNGQEWVQKRSEEIYQFVKEQVGFPPTLNKKMILGEHSPRGSQARLSNDHKLCIIAESTGVGKTEAALLRHSQRKENLIFLLPTQSTTNAMMKRVEKIYEGQEAVIASLAHGLAFMEDFYDERQKDYQSDDYQGLTKTDFTKVVGGRLAASVNVATIDQMLMGALPVKWTHLRLLLLANAHVIIDEAHLLDDYQVELLKPLLFFLSKVGARVTILSATLPDWLEESFMDAYLNQDVSRGKASFPSLSFIDDQNNFVRHSLPANEYVVKYDITETDKIIDTHIAWAVKSYNDMPRSRMGIFVNQIDRAQKIALELAKKFPEATVLCLHSRMLAGHKKAVIEKLLQLTETKTGQGRGIILVGTQIVEMSLDIDLDLLSTDLCPAPAFIQRLGRQWRDKSSQERFRRISKDVFDQQAHIVVPLKIQEEGVDKIMALPYSKSTLDRTHEFLENKNGEVSFPRDVQDFVETVRYDDSFDYELDESTMDEKAAEMIKAMKGGLISVDLQSLCLQNPEVQDFSQMTSSVSLDESLATRFIEYNNASLILKTENKSLQELGALPIEIESNTLVETTSLSKIQLATISLSRTIEKELEKSSGKSLEQLKTKTGGLSYFGELPDTLEYNYLVGLRIT